MPRTTPAAATNPLRRGAASQGTATSTRRGNMDVVNNWATTHPNRPKPMASPGSTGAMVNADAPVANPNPTQTGGPPLVAAPRRTPNPTTGSPPSTTVPRPYTAPARPGRVSASASVESERRRIRGY